MFKRKCCRTRKIPYEIHRKQIIDDVLLRIPCALKQIIQEYASITCIFSESVNPVLEHCDADEMCQIDAYLSLQIRGHDLYVCDMFHNTREKLEYEKNISFRNCEFEKAQEYVFIFDFEKVLFRFHIPSKTLFRIFQSSRATYQDIEFLNETQILLHVKKYKKFAIYNNLLHTWTNYNIPKLETNMTALSVFKHFLVCISSGQLFVLNLTNGVWQSINQHDDVEVPQYCGGSNYLPNECYVKARSAVYKVDVDHLRLIFIQNGIDYLLEKNTQFYCVTILSSDQLNIQTSMIPKYPTLMALFISVNRELLDFAIVGHEVGCVLLSSESSVDYKTAYFINFVTNQILFGKELLRTDKLFVRNGIVGISHNYEICDRTCIEMSKDIFVLPKIKLDS